MRSIGILGRLPPSYPLPDFLALPADERLEVYNTVAPKINRTPAILEKDVWVCWTLETLFDVDDHPQMAFKGGTSLSKAYDAISRFSEDIDVTIDHRGLDSTINPFATGISRKQRDRDADALLEGVRKCVRDLVNPHFLYQLQTAFPNGEWQLDIVNEGDELRLAYPRVVEIETEFEAEYIRDFVKIEFGGRNITEPNENHTIHPYLLGHVTGASLPSADVTVLSGARTFWEKATLAHVECNRTEPKPDVRRLSRHWYDLFKLADHNIGRAALADRALLSDVVKYKKVFYNTAYANYNDCLDGGFRLIPNDAGLTALRDDYAQMISKAMIYDEVPSFSAIVERLGRLETEINAGVTGTDSPV